MILPDGNYKFLKDKDAASEIKMWVQQGGKLIAFENAAAQVAKADWGIKLKKSDDEDKKDDKKDEQRAIRRYKTLRKQGTRFVL